MLKDWRKMAYLLLESSACAVILALRPAFALARDAKLFRPDKTTIRNENNQAGKVRGERRKGNQGKSLTSRPLLLHLPVESACETRGIRLSCLTSSALNALSMLGYP